MARKLKLKTLRKVFYKLGKDLGCNVINSKGKSCRTALFTPSNYKRKPIVSLTGNKDPFKTLDQI